MSILNPVPLPASPPVSCSREAPRKAPPPADPVRRVRAALHDSDFLRTVAAVRADGGRSFALGRAKTRPLTTGEIRQLEGQGNSCPDWSRVRVGEGFQGRTVRQSNFHGDVILGAFRGLVALAEGVSLPAGIERSTIVDCVIAADVLIRDVKLLANYVVGPECVLLDCGSISCDLETAFANGMVLSLGVESGGRDVAVYAEMDTETAATIARSRQQPALLRDYATAVADYAREALSPRGALGRGTAIRSTPQVRNTYCGPGTQVDGATRIVHCTLLGDADDPVQVGSGACLTDVLVQWGSRVATHAVVERSVLTEHAHADRHARVTHSVLGCNSGVAGGEVTSSLLGPFVNFHHQALLIAALWPEGKGNVSYGANVGSNHTGKAPDQEFIPGEGLFLGLGVNVKYPADFSEAPYTVIATGVTTLPQRLRFPFSLVNLPAAHYPDLSPAFNQIVPAWMLTENLYALKRTEAKHRARNQARRTPLDCDVFRPSLVDLMRAAAQRLEQVKHRKEVYTERDIEGLGKNYLLEGHRVAALDAYRFFIAHYALRGLQAQAQRLVDEGQAHQVAGLLLRPAGPGVWEHQRSILHDELGHRDVVAALRLLPAMLEQMAGAVERSKAKDDERGPGIIADYAAVHVPAARDGVVRHTWEETRQLQRAVQELIERCERGAPPI